MGALDKIMFWKKREDPFAAGNLNAGLGLGSGNAGLNASTSRLGMDVSDPLAKGPNLGIDPSSFSSQNMPDNLSSNYPAPSFGNEQSQRFESYEKPVIARELNPSNPYAPVSAHQEFSPRDYTMEKNMEVISSKLDALRAALDSINQRLTNIERIAQQEQEQQFRGPKRW